MNFKVYKRDGEKIYGTIILEGMCKNLTRNLVRNLKRKKLLKRG